MTSPEVVRALAAATAADLRADAEWMTRLVNEELWLSEEFVACAHRLAGLALAVMYRTVTP